MLFDILLAMRLDLATVTSREPDAAVASMLLRVRREREGLRLIEGWGRPKQIRGIDASAAASHGSADPGRLRCRIISLVFTSM